MATTQDAHTLSGLAIDTIPTAARWSAYLIPVRGFPVDPADNGIPHFVAALCETMVRRKPVTMEVFFQIAELHRGDASEKLGAKGREWIPMMGLGVWPDRERPRLWTMEDFKNMDPAVGPPKLMYQLFRVSTAQSQRGDAIRVMAGLGVLAVILAHPPEDHYLSVSSPSLSANIRERALLGLPFYAPLLEAKSLKDTAAEQLESWIGGASLYLRESPEDSGVLIVSREPLDSTFAELGARSSAGKPGRWEIMSRRLG